MAYGRALETERADRLFADPWAQHLVNASGWVPPSSGQTILGRAGPTGASWLVIRTRFIDDALLDTVRRGCRQVVLLGAGLDTRALRLTWPAQTRIFEIDNGDVLDFKQAVLRDIGATVDLVSEHVLLPVDVTQDVTGPLVAAGFSPSAPSVWVAEGLMLYLTAEENDNLLVSVSSLAVAGSRLILTLTSAGQHAREETAAAQGCGVHNPFWVSDGPDDPAGWLAKFGWQADVVHPGERAHAYGRDLAADYDPSRPPRRHLVDAIRRPRD